jgi:hypothetical protein
MSDKGRELQHFRGHASGIHQREFNRRQAEITALRRELEDSEMTDLTLEMDREPTEADLAEIEAEDIFNLDDSVLTEDDYVPDDLREVEFDDEYEYEDE